MLAAHVRVIWHGKNKAGGPVGGQSLRHDRQIYEETEEAALLITRATRRPAENHHDEAVEPWERLRVFLG